MTKRALLCSWFMGTTGQKKPGKLDKVNTIFFGLELLVLGTLLHEQVAQQEKKIY